MVLFVIVILCNLNAVWISKAARIGNGCLSSLFSKHYCIAVGCRGFSINPVAIHVQDLLSNCEPHDGIRVQDLQTCQFASVFKILFMGK